MRRVGLVLVLLAAAAFWLLPTTAGAGLCTDCGVQCTVVCVQGQCQWDCYEVCLQDLWDGTSGCRWERFGDDWFCFPDGYPCHIYLV